MTQTQKPPQSTILYDFKHTTLQMTKTKGILNGVKDSLTQLPGDFCVLPSVHDSNKPIDVVTKIAKSNLYAKIPNESLCQVSNPSCLTLISFTMHKQMTGIIKITYQSKSINGKLIMNKGLFFP